MIEKLKGQTESGAQVNLTQLLQCIAELFPAAVEERVAESSYSERSLEMEAGAAGGEAQKDSLEDSTGHKGSTLGYRAINWKQLGDLLGLEIKVKEATALEGKAAGIAGYEPFGFFWPGKRAAIRDANRPINLSFRPCREESKDWDCTQNLYFKGDNLEVLKLLQGSYLGKVKMIYIDPPYNTGNDSFVYRDDFSQSRSEFEYHSGIRDEATGALMMRPNNSSSGRYHSSWCSMMYARLLVARSLLRQDGVIFISIDDHEQHHLRDICDEIFGEQNFVSQLIWQRAFSPKNDAKYVSTSHDYVLMYARSIENFKIGRLPFTDAARKRYACNDGDPRGPWTAGDLSAKTYNLAYDYPITTPTGKVVYPPKGACWRVSKERFAELLADNRIVFGQDGNGTPMKKRFLSENKFEGMVPTSILYDASLVPEDESEDVLYEGLRNCASSTQIVSLLEVIKELAERTEGKGKAKSINSFLSKVEKDSKIGAFSSMLFYRDVGHSAEGTKELKALMNDGVFDGPKPVRLLRHLMTLANLDPQAGDIVLDFFSGSATTAEAVMQANVEDGGNRRFILVQFTELCATNSPAAQAGYSNICEIGLERIRRAGEVLSCKVAQQIKHNLSLEKELAATTLPESCTKIVHGGGVRAY